MTASPGTDAGRNLSPPPASNRMTSFGRSQPDDAAFSTPAGGPPVDVSADLAIDLLRQAQAGDRAAFGQLVVLCQDRLYNAVLRMVGDREEAAELTQETFAKAYEKVAGWRGDAAPYTWLFRIAVNLSIGRLRQSKRRRTFSLDGNTNGHGRGVTGRRDQASGLVDRLRSDGRRTAPGPVDPARSAEDRERAEQVVAALGRVPPDARAMLVMRDVEGFDYQQIADVLALPLGTVKSRLFRARLALRDELKAYMGAR